MLVIGGGYSKLKVYVHVQERGEGGAGSKITKSERTYFMDEPFV